MPVSGYFQPLMKQLRSYIARLLVALLVFSGFSLYVVQPAQAGHTSNAFARWLSMMAKTSDASDLQKELQDLRGSSAQLADLLEQASRIVTQNTEEFNFPFVKEDGSQELYQLLLIEWNQFQTGNAMAGVPAQQMVVKPLLSLHMDKGGSLGSAAIIQDRVPSVFERVCSKPVLQPAAKNTVEPMSDGIAIGAP